MVSYKIVAKELGGNISKALIRNSRLLNDIRLILSYHRVVRSIPGDFHDPAMLVQQSTLDMHLKEVSKFFDVVPLEMLINAKRGKEKLCSITFDDGWLDTYTTAFPILQKYQVPATVFLPAAMIGTTRWFWFESLMNLAKMARKNGSSHSFIEYFRHAVPCWTASDLAAKHILTLTSELKHLPGNELDGLITNAYKEFNLPIPKNNIIMGWEEVSQMGKCGITFGSHGLNHYILPNLDPNLKRNEIVESLEVLKGKDVPTVFYFAYPNGDWDKETLYLLSEAGYRGALTTKLGYNVLSTPPFLLNRVSMHKDISHTPALFWCRIFQAVLAGSGHQRGKMIPRKFIR